MIGRRALSGYVFCSIELAEKQIEVIAAASLPLNWADGVARIESQLFGDRRVLEGRTLSLRVPSKVMPGEFNYLINPLHPDFAAAPKSKPIPYAHDPRLA
jgi:RES domain-containing protein